MTILYWLAISIGGIVAYVGIAGVMFRWMGGVDFDNDACLALIPVLGQLIAVGVLCWPGFWEQRESNEQWKRDELASVVALLWPVALVARMPYWVAVRPLRSVWRLTSGETNQKENKNGKS